MKLKTGTLGTTIGWGLLFTSFIAVLAACGDGNDDANADKTPPQRSAALTFQLELESPPVKAAAGRAIGMPDICTDHQIDSITVQVFRTLDDTEVALVHKPCADHGMTIDNIPSEESLRMVVQAHSGIRRNWLRQVNDIVVEAGQTKDMGTIHLAYIGEDIAAPAIASKHPAENAVGVDLSSWIAVVFNEALAPSSIPDQAIIVLSGNTPVPGKVDYDPASNAVYFTPADTAGLAVDTTYTATFQIPRSGSGGLTDIAGHSFTGDVLNWQFTTRGAGDSTAPHVIAVSPANGATRVGQNVPITILFSESMDPASFADSVFTLSSNHGVVNGQVAYDDNTRSLELTFEGALEGDTEYTAALSTDVKDLAQNPLDAHYVWTFWTSVPEYELKTEKTGNGSGTISSTGASDIDCGTTCQAVLSAGASVTLEAVAGDGSVFNGWTGGTCNGQGGSCTFTMTGNITVSADFCVRSQGPHSIDASISPEDGSGGTISPMSATVNDGKDKVFEITAEPFYSVVNLLVDGSALPPSSSFRFEKVIKDHTLHATFTHNTANISNNSELDMDYNIRPKINFPGHVVWTAKIGGAKYDIYYEDGLSSTDPVLTKNLSTPSYDPEINDDGYVVWDTGWTFDNKDVYYYDKSKITNLTEDQNEFPGGHFLPNINNNGHVVWQCKNGSEYYVYYWNSHTANVISNKSVSNNTQPQINNSGHVVWAGTNPGSGMDIFYYNGIEVENISDQESQPGNHAEPKINDNGHVVWRYYHGNKVRIYYFDGTNTISIAETTSGGFGSPEINIDGHVVWAGQSADGKKGVLYYSGSGTAANISATLDLKAYWPQINKNGHVVWWSSADDSYDLYNYYYYDGTSIFNLTNNTEPIPIDQVGSWDIRINDNNEVVWHFEASSGNVEIYRSAY